MSKPINKSNKPYLPREIHAHILKFCDSSTLKVCAIANKEFKSLVYERHLFMLYIHGILKIDSSTYDTIKKLLDSNKNNNWLKSTVFYGIIKSSRWDILEEMIDIFKNITIDDTIHDISYMLVDMLKNGKYNLVTYMINNKMISVNRVNASTIMGIISTLGTIDLILLFANSTYVQKFNPNNLEKYKFIMSQAIFNVKFIKKSIIMVRDSDDRRSIYNICLGPKNLLKAIPWMIRDIKYKRNFAFILRILEDYISPSRPYILTSINTVVNNIVYNRRWDMLKIFAKSKMALYINYDQALSLINELVVHMHPEPDVIHLYNEIKFLEWKKDNNIIPNL